MDTAPLSFCEMDQAGVTRKPSPRVAGQCPQWVVNGHDRDGWSADIGSASSAPSRKHNEEPPRNAGAKPDNREQAQAERIQQGIAWVGQVQRNPEEKRKRRRRGYTRQCVRDEPSSAALNRRPRLWTFHEQAQDAGGYQGESRRPDGHNCDGRRQGVGPAAAPRRRRRVDHQKDDERQERRGDGSREHCREAALAEISGRQAISPIRWPIDAPIS